MILNRQKMLLFLLRIAGGEASKLQMMKWSFLVAEVSPNRGGGNFYQFLPYRFGPYSFCLENEITHLRRQSLVRLQEENIWRLTIDGAKEANTLPTRLSNDVDYVIRNYGHLKTDELIGRVYTEHPWFTINCDAVDKRTLERPNADREVYTIGYSGFSIDGFLDRLMRIGIVRVIDVRNNPSSRKYGFSKNRLALFCSLVGIEYESFPELGIPHEQRRTAHTDSEYCSLFSTYRCGIVTQQQAAISSVSSFLQQEPSVLMCLESDPERCHRSHLARVMLGKGKGEITHL